MNKQKIFNLAIVAVMILSACSAAVSGNAPAPPQANDSSQSSVDAVEPAPTSTFLPPPAESPTPYVYIDPEQEARIAALETQVATSNIALTQAAEANQELEDVNRGLVFLLTVQDGQSGLAFTEVDDQTADVGAPVDGGSPADTASGSPAPSASNSSGSPVVSANTNSPTSTPGSSTTTTTSGNTTTSSAAQPNSPYANSSGNVACPACVAGPVTTTPFPTSLLAPGTINIIFIDPGVAWYADKENSAGRPIMDIREPRLKFLIGATLQVFTNRIDADGGIDYFEIWDPDGVVTQVLYLRDRDIQFQRDLSLPPNVAEGVVGEEKINLLEIDSYNSGGRPVFKIAEPRVQYDPGETIYLIAREIKGDGGGYYFEVYDKAAGESTGLYIGWARFSFLNESR